MARFEFAVVEQFSDVAAVIEEEEKEEENKGKSSSNNKWLFSAMWKRFKGLQIVGVSGIRVRGSQKILRGVWESQRFENCFGWLIVLASATKEDEPPRKITAKLVTTTKLRTKKPKESKT